jgi:hypothetical protein
MYIKYFILTLIFIASYSVNGEVKAQNFNNYNTNKTDVFKERAAFYRMPTYSGTDTKEKFLGYVEITIKQTSDGFRLTAIDGNKIKMDNPGIDWNNNQSGQVHECDYSDDFWHQAHYRKNGISYIVLFSSKRIRNYYISH